MVDTTSKPKQMATYDRFALTGSGYIPHDDNGDFDEEEVINGDPLQDLKNCTYCSTELLKVEDEVIQKSSHRQYCLWYCRNCRFWQARLYSDPFRSCMPPPDYWAYISKLREFNPIPEGCDAELALHIRLNPDLLHSFDPIHFEKFVADVFRANYTNAEVLHVGKPYDGGVDVLLIDDSKEQWLIQVKRRKSKNHSEGIDTIRNVLGAMHLNGVRRGIVVSTAKQFSKYARQGAGRAKAGEYPMIIQLVDKEIFNKMLDPILPDRPWLLPISELDTDLARYLEDQIPSDNRLEVPRYKVLNDHQLEIPFPEK